MTIDNIFNIVVIIYSMSNLASLGMELNLRETIRSLSSVKLIVFTLVFGWIAGPALAYLLAKVLPIDKSYGLGLMICSLAPVAPFYPILIRKSNSDKDFGAALMPLAMVATVVMLPLLGPFIIKGLSVNVWSLAKPLLLLILLPLVCGILLRLYAPRFTDRIFPSIKRLAGISTVIAMLFVIVLYFSDFISILGSFAIGAQVLFVFGIMFISYFLAIGLKKNQRSAIALGMGSRNPAAMLVVYIALQITDPKMLLMILLAGPVPGITSYFVALFFGSRADKASVKV
jgi:BASS family bile acid:Na+ symporter